MAVLLNGAALENVLARGDVWLGDSLASLPDATVPSGFPELDAALPGGGWPCGNLAEMLVDRAGLGELSLWLPALARLSGQGGRIALVAPPFVPYVPAWRAAGVAPERLVVVQAGAAGSAVPGRGRQSRANRPADPDAAWCCEQLLACGGFAAVLAWLPAGLDARRLRRLQVAAADRPALACLWRPAALRHEASPAPLRLCVELPADAAALPSTASRRRNATALQVRIVKRRGRPATQPLILSLPYPGHVHRALARPRSAQPAGRSAGLAVVA